MHPNRILFFWPMLFVCCAMGTARETIRLFGGAA